MLNIQLLMEKIKCKLTVVNQTRQIIQSSHVMCIISCLAIYFCDFYKETERGRQYEAPSTVSIKVLLFLKGKKTGLLKYFKNLAK